MPQKEIAPRLANVTMVPDINIPANMDGTACFRGILNRKAATQPVHAPVTGRGIATKRISPIASNLSINLLFLIVRLNNHVKKVSNTLKRLLSQSETVPKKRRMGITGRKFPATETI